MVELTEGKISIEQVLAQVEDHSAGAVVLFLGRVRDHAEGRQVNAMDYEAYPQMALRKMQEIETAVKKRWPVEKMVLLHRTGHLKLGEVSVAIAVASPHRKDAFEAGRFAIDTLKETVPIWKKEYTVDSAQWATGKPPKPLESLKPKEKREAP
ncbi:MAG: molybdenum cofactor biosynthesis protein MoaE [bacterium]